MKTAAKPIESSITDTHRLLSKQEVIGFLKISPTTLFELTRRKQNPIPSVKIGKSRRFPLDKVRNWVDALEQ